MIYDCAIIGGGPAGLNAALTLGRARKNVILFDDGNPRNAVSKESHGFITRDGITPGEFRRLAHADILKYSSVELRSGTVSQINEQDGSFRLLTKQGEAYSAARIILATGLKEKLPAIEGLKQLYGVSLFQCPFCDGWELRDQPLAVISETESGFNVVKLLTNWSKDVLLCTNGSGILSEEQRILLQDRGIPVYEERIKALVGKEGKLERIVFENGEEVGRSGGLVTPEWESCALGRSLGCKFNDYGWLEVDELGHTSRKGVYAAGDAANVVVKQLIVAAGEGNKAAIGVIVDSIMEQF